MAAIAASGGHVNYDWMPDDPFCDPDRRSGPEWLRKLLGDDFFSTVEYADLNTAQIGSLRSLPHIETLSLEGEMTPEVVTEIGRLHSLKDLTLHITRMTDAEIANLRGLSSLQTLDLSRTNVTDAGLENLTGLHHLKALILNDTELTDAGLKNLRELNLLERLELSETWVTGVGIAGLKRVLPHTQIWFSTRISAEELRSIREFIAQLPEVRGYNRAKRANIMRREGGVEVSLQRPGELGVLSLTLKKTNGKWSLAAKSYDVGEGAGDYE